MPFLDKDILVQLLKTYPKTKIIEEKYASILKNPNLLDYFKTIRDSSTNILNLTSRFFGFNTPEDSEAVYLELRALIDDATKFNRAESWTDILCTAGEGGYHTYMNSARKSDLTKVSFALLMYIRNQIDSRINNIENKIKTLEERLKSAPNRSRTLEDKLLIYRDILFLDADDELAIKIHMAINHRIEGCRKFIQEAKDNLNRSKELKFTTVYSTKLKINAETGQKFLSSSEEEIEIAQRQLYFLGDNKFDKDPYLKPSRNLFDGFKFYSAELRQEYKLTDEQIASLSTKLQLPIYLQRIYPFLYFRDAHQDIKGMTDEGMVIESFEQLERIKAQPETPSDNLVKNSLPRTSAISRLGQGLVVNTEQASTPINVVPQVSEAKFFQPVSQNQGNGDAAVPPVVMSEHLERKL